jgi:hypothetical protein
MSMQQNPASPFLESDVFDALFISAAAVQGSVHNAPTPSFLIAADQN